jgi:hypothetical protein
MAPALDGTEAADRAWARRALGLLDLGQGGPSRRGLARGSYKGHPYAYHVCAYRSVPDLVEEAVRHGVAGHCAVAALPGGSGVAVQQDGDGQPDDDQSETEPQIS